MSDHVDMTTHEIEELLTWLPPTLVVIAALVAAVIAVCAGRGLMTQGSQGADDKRK